MLNASIRASRDQNTRNRHECRHQHLPQRFLRSCNRVHIRVYVHCDVSTVRTGSWGRELADPCM
jgi:hypothetical protein